jgi:hypothetical protein
VKTPDKFRFTLQWGAETVEKVQAGELLESLGNRKSEFVVLAVSEYIRLHPEALTSGQKLRIVVRPSFTRGQLETMVRSILEEKMAGSVPIPPQSGGSVGIPQVGAEIDEMLSNLDLFK